MEPLKMSMPTLQGTHEKYWFYLNLTLKTETFIHVQKR